MAKWACLGLVAFSVACSGSDATLQASNQSCITLGGSGLTAAEALEEFFRDTSQVQIEVKVLAVDETDLRDFGVDFDFEALIEGDVPPEQGGTSNEQQSSSVDGNLLGGAEGVGYALPANQQPLDFLPIINNLFQRPPGDFRPVVQVPFPGFCIVLAPQVRVPIQGFQNLQSRTLPDFTGGLGGQTLKYTMLDDAQVSTFIQTVLQDNRNTILEHPQVITLNDRQGTVFVGDGVQTDINEIVSPFRVEIEKTVTNPLAIFPGIALHVTPHIRDNGVIIMEVHPAQALTFFFSTPVNVGGNQADLEIPIIQRSTNFSSLAVRDGMTLVIGGLIDDTMTEHRGVPFLKDLPVIGNVFRGVKTNDMQELIVMVTPRIVAR